jgi:DNA polymerase III subunit chi
LVRDTVRDNVEMTQISFHFNVPQRLDYACRLLRKALRLQSQVAVLGDDDVLAQLDRQLWVFDPLDFVPHIRVTPGQNGPPYAGMTPLWLVDDLSQVPHQDVLLNLSSQVPLEFDKFSRLVEIVSLEPLERQQARSRWKHYAQFGALHSITRHDVGQETSA